MKEVTGEDLLRAEKIREAAPDLLDALQDLAKDYKMSADSGDCGSWNAEEQPIYIKAMAAIKKATE